MKPTSPGSRAAPAVPPRPLGAGGAPQTRTAQQCGGSNVGAGLDVSGSASSSASAIAGHTGLRTGFTKLSEGAAAPLSVSGPTNVQRVLHVEWDSATGTFKGMPEVWKSSLPEGVASDTDASGSSVSALPEHVAPIAPSKKVDKVYLFIRI